MFFQLGDDQSASAPIPVIVLFGPHDLTCFRQFETCRASVVVEALKAGSLLGGFLDTSRHNGVHHFSDEQFLGGDGDDFVDEGCEGFGLGGGDECGEQCDASDQFFHGNEF